MVQIVKKEWHQVTSIYTYELTLDDLQKIYPETDIVDLQKMLDDLKSGDLDLDDLLSDARDNDIDIEWDHDDDDWWTDRKGGYDVTYELGE